MKTSRVLLTAILLFNVFGELCAQPLGFSIMDNRRKVEIPIEIYNNLVVVPIVLNGTLPLKFVLDTGVRTAILTQKTFSDLLNLQYSRKYTITGPGGQRMVDAYITNNVSLTLPGVMGRGQALLVLDQDYLQLRNYLGTDVHGILGYELFSRFIIEVDYDRRLLTLHSPKHFKKRGKFQSIPITVEDTKPYIIVPLVLSNGEEIQAKLLVDSGASHPLLLDPLSDQKIVVPSRVVSSTIGRGLGGEITGKTGRIKAISIGPYKLREVVANFPDPNSYSDTSRVKAFRNGTIGGGLLNRFDVIYDFSSEHLHIRKSGHFKQKFHYNVSGLTVRSTGIGLNLDEYEIIEVREGSAGDKAGLKVGDKIVTMNGVSREYLRLSNIMAKLSQRPGKKVSLEIERDGQKKKVKLILSDQI